jgi:hypothetical protein
MHLLLAQKGTITDGEEAIDLGQSPADILFLSAADTELSSIAAAHRTRVAKPSLRVASLLTLKHPMSVDTYVERTARHAKLIIVRPLGGASYFHYVLEALHAAAVTHRFQIAVLPGCDKPDPGLEPFSTVSAEDRNRMWAYFTEGGADNMARLLRYAEALIDGSEKPESAAPLMKAGIWWPGQGVIGVEAWKKGGWVWCFPARYPPLSALLTSPPQGGRSTRGIHLDEPKRNFIDCRTRIYWKSGSVLQRSPSLRGRCPTGQRGVCVPETRASPSVRTWSREKVSPPRPSRSASTAPLFKAAKPNL